jgi:hypothetical protein
MKNEEFLVVVRWMNGRISKRSAPSLHRSQRILQELKKKHGRLITWLIYKDGEKIKQGWK